MILFCIAMIALRLLCLAFLVLLAIFIVSGMRSRHDTALVILQKRFVDGEISAEEFAKRREVLVNN